MGENNVTTIAVIGSHWFIKNFQEKTLKEWHSTFSYYPYDSFDEAPHIVKKITYADVLLFAGSFPYEVSKHNIAEKNLPALYVKQDVNALLLALTKALLQGYTLAQISIDYRHQEEWDKLVQELGGKVPKLAFAINYEMQTEQVMALHEKNIANITTALVITSIHQVAENLLQKKITAQMALDSHTAIANVVERAVQIATLNQVSDAQIAVGYITLKENATSSIEAIAHQLDAIVKQEAHVMKLYTTVGKLNRFLASDVPLTWLTALEQPIAIGFGSAETLLKAEQRAKDACHYKLHNHRQQNVFYYIDLEERLIGPYPHVQQHVDLAITSEYLFELSQKTTLSPKNISKIIQFDQLNKNSNFTIDDLAAYLQVTRRSAERLLKKMIATPYLIQVGEKTSAGKGRPKSIYRLNL